jgi:predicted RNA-binding Zn-ribbon protein involved in translation (DUF1610 family)
VSRTPRSVVAWAEGFVDEQGLDPATWAGQRVEEELKADETVRALVLASRAADERQSDVRDFSTPDTDPLVDDLVDARRSVEDALDSLGERIVEETCDVTVEGHSVDLRHATRLDCPDCGETVEAFYLGSKARTGHGGEVVEGWLCHNCGAQLERHGQDVVEVVEEGGRA